MDKLWIVDGHCDSLGDLTDGKRDLRGNNDTGHWDLARARQGHIGLQFFAAYIESEYKPFLAIQRGLLHLEAALKFIDENRDEVFLITNRGDIDRLYTDRLKISNQIGLLLHVEGGEILGESLEMVDIIYRLGVRSLGLTWNERNAIADGVGELDSQGGLSNFGKRVIKRMNSLGIIVDVSHINEAGFWDVIQCSDKPIIASHSCARSLCDHCRNLRDDQLKAISECNGVVGVNFCQDFLCENGQANIDDVVRHICHIAEIAGVDAVGFGSDYDGIPSPPSGLDDVSKFPYLIDKLIQRGFSSSDIQKICHRNFVRVIQDVIK